MAKPSDFYVGVIDLFSIMLPGAILTWVCWARWGADPAVQAFLPGRESGQWVAFLLAAFGVGHLVFMVASLVDLSFDWFRKRVLTWTLPPFRRAVEESAYQAASALRTVGLATEPSAAAGSPAARAETWARAMLRAREGMPTIPLPTNTYQWSRAVLRLRAPAALGAVVRLEADSKFFRSLFVVFLLLAIAAPLDAREGVRLPLSVPLLLLFAALSYWRYAEQRAKGITEAYRAVIVCLAMGGNAAGGAEPSDD
jgi:hypothetical protein